MSSSSPNRRSRRREKCQQDLMIKSLDDLKDKLAKVILLILIVMFFEQALFLKPTAPLELLYYSLAIMLVALALYLSHKAMRIKLRPHQP